MWGPTGGCSGGGRADALGWVPATRCHPATSGTLHACSESSEGQDLGVQWLHLPEAVGLSLGRNQPLHPGSKSTRVGWSGEGGGPR